MVEVINRKWGRSPSGGWAADPDSGTDSPDARVNFIGRIENLEVRPMQTAAKVIVNPRTGSVVMNQAVTLTIVPLRTATCRWW